ncbi:MAG: AAA family ATPase, partial [Ruminiclostridium sp.]
SLYSSVFIMNTPIKPAEFLVEKLFTRGLYILAGAPKVGKSWLVLDLCLSVSKGDKFLGHDTKCGGVVYLSLEDSLLRLQNRLYELTEEPSDNLSFALTSGILGDELEKQIENCKKKDSNLKLVVIDTLQKVRSCTESTYGSDYKELSSLKTVADRLGITILIVHHTRKCYDKDPFNTISGTTGISGSADGCFVLVEKKRGSREAVLYGVGRDIENLEIEVVFENNRWRTSEEAEETKPDIFSFAVHDFMVKQKSFRGRATDLCEQIKEYFQEELFPNRITRDLLQHSFELTMYGVSVRTTRSNGQRLLLLDYSPNSDSSDGRILVPPPIKVTDPADPVTVTNPLTEPQTDSDSRNENPENAESTDPVKKVTDPVSRDNFIRRVADMMYNRLREQEIPVAPFREE